MRIKNLSILISPLISVCMMTLSCAMIVGVKEAPVPTELSGRVLIPSNLSSYKAERIHVYSRNGTKLYGSAIPYTVTNSMDEKEVHWRKFVAIPDVKDCTFWVQLSTPLNNRIYYNQGLEEYIVDGQQYDLPVTAVQIPLFTADDLKKIGTDDDLYPMNDNYVLIRDIKLNGEWEPFGKNQATAFTGTFDGNYRTISSLSLAGAAREYVGFFGYIRGATVKNLILEIEDKPVNLSTTTKQSIGILAGYSEASNIENVLVRGAGLLIEKSGGSSFRVGGIVGTFSAPGTETYKIIGCASEVSIAVHKVDSNLSASDESAYGGIVGLVYRGVGAGQVEIEKCYSSETISAFFSKVRVTD